MLYVVRHATPRINRDIPARDWQLSPEGIDEARALARVATAWGLRAVYSSTELKARATADAISAAVGLTFRSLEDLDELRMDGWFEQRDAFEAFVRSVFHRPSDSVEGAEPARVAAERFGGAVGVVRSGPLPAAAVSHGRVIAAWLAHLLDGIDALEVWRSIPMPGYAIIDLDDHPLRLVRPFQPLPRTAG